MERGVGLEGRVVDEGGEYKRDSWVKQVVLVIVQWPNSYDKQYNLIMM